VILLDTHVLIWLDQGNPRLGAEARAALDRSLKSDGLAVSALSFWEVGTLIRKGRMKLSQDPATWRDELLQAGLQERPVTGDIGLTAASLEAFHANPADRIIVATALHEGAVLCTADQRILDWTGAVQCLDARV